MALWSGPCPLTTAALACSDDSCGSVGLSSISKSLAAGTNYIIAIGTSADTVTHPASVSVGISVSSRLPCIRGSRPVHLPRLARSLAVSLRVVACWSQPCCCRTFACPSLSSAVRLCLCVCLLVLCRCSLCLCARRAHGSCMVRIRAGPPTVKLDRK